MAKTITEILEKASRAPGFQREFPAFFRLTGRRMTEETTECFKNVTIRRLPKKGEWFRVLK